MMEEKTTGKVQIVEKNEGTKIPMVQKNCRLIFGDDDLSVRLDNRQREYPVHLDIFADEDGNLTMGTGRDYVAQIDIPGYSYPEPEAAADDTGETGGETGGGSPEPLSLDMSLVVVTLWSVDGIMDI